MIYPEREYFPCISNYILEPSGVHVPSSCESSIIPGTRIFMIWENKIMVVGYAKANKINYLWNYIGEKLGITQRFNLITLNPIRCSPRKNSSTTQCCHIFIKLFCVRFFFPRSIIISKGFLPIAHFRKEST